MSSSAAASEWGALTHGASNHLVVVQCETREESFELWVANAGQPITEAAVDKLFERFFRANAHATR